MTKTEKERKKGKEGGHAIKAADGVSQLLVETVPKEPNQSVTFKSKDSIFAHHTLATTA